MRSGVDLPGRHPERGHHHHRPGDRSGPLRSARGAPPSGDERSGERRRALDRIPHRSGAGAAVPDVVRRCADRLDRIGGQGAAGDAQVPAGDLRARGARDDAHRLPLQRLGGRGQPERRALQRRDRGRRRAGRAASPRVGRRRHPGAARSLPRRRRGALLRSDARAGRAEGPPRLLRLRHRVADEREGAREAARGAEEAAGKWTAGGSRAGSSRAGDPAPDAARPRRRSLRREARGRHRERAGGRRELGHLGERFSRGFAGIAAWIDRARGAGCLGRVAHERSRGRAPVTHTGAAGQDRARRVRAERAGAWLRRLRLRSRHRGRMDKSRTTPRAAPITTRPSSCWTWSSARCATTAAAT